MEHLKIDRVIRQLEQLYNMETPKEPSRIAMKRRGRPPGSKNRPKLHAVPSEN